MDWDTFYFEYWEQNLDTSGTDPTLEDFQDWLFDKADLALGED